ncbi:MAG: glycoside hydrolase family 3 C-terminal domain-containing protein [Clostridia bacterium]|nr:glycoside hydrolase family 3 C-terminal domain-containing protein [Clostridia bacterium]
MQKFFGYLKKHIGLWRMLAIIFVIIFVLGYVVGALLEANSAQVNRVLKTTTSRVEADEELYATYIPDDAYVTYDAEGNIIAGDTEALVKAHKDLGEKLSEEGSVLLKNDSSALPFTANSAKVTLFGRASAPSGSYYGMNIGGTVESSQNVSLYDALVSRGVDVNSAMTDYYEANASKSGTNSLPMGFTTITTEQAFTPYEAAVADNVGTLMSGYSKTDAGDNSIGIVVIGRPSSEAGDYYPGSIGVSDSELMDTSVTTGNILGFTAAELKTISTAKTYCSKVIVLINTSNPMELGPIMSGTYEADAIMWIGFPGNYGFNGVADVLVGNSNPSGRLADTFAMDSTSSPAMQNFGLYKFTNGDKVSANDCGSYYVVEAESIYTGYKYYETRYEDSVLGQGDASDKAGAFASNATSWVYDDEVAYSFGYGLSYTTFTQEIDTSKADGKGYSLNGTTLTIYYKVTNTGDKDGQTVVQVYGQSPYYTDSNFNHGDVEKASVELLNYAKTPVITKNGTYSGSIDIDLTLLASYDETLNNNAGGYVLDNGTYYFALGNNEDADGAHAAINNILGVKDSTANLDQTANTAAVATVAITSDNTSFTNTASNQLQDADLNYWEENDPVTYLSRSDWTWKGGNGADSDTSGWNTNMWSGLKEVELDENGDEVKDSDGNPVYTGNVLADKGYVGIKATDAMLTQLGNDTYTVSTTDDTSKILWNQDNGLKFADMIDTEGNVKDYDDESWTKLIEELDPAEAIGFIAQGNRVYMQLTGPNFLSGTYTENGPVGLNMSLPSDDFGAPWYDDTEAGYTLSTMGCATLQAAAFDQDLQQEIGELWGNDSLFGNLPVLWAPSLNVHRTPYNGRSAEYYSEDAILSGYSAAGVVKGSREYGLIVCLKHFAMNDQESNRRGVAVFATEQQMRENELRGFQIAFAAGALGTMTSFNRIGCTFSSAHTGLISGILRGEWGYRGYAITDMASSTDYFTFPETVIAGTTNFDNTGDENDWGKTSDLAKAYANDATLMQAIQDAVHNTLYSFAYSNMVNYMTPTAHTVKVWNWWRCVYTALEVIGGVIAGLSLVAYVLALVVPVKKEEEA